MAIKDLREDRRPADLWYWNDWFSSFDVRSCSLAARGLWVDMLGIMSRASVKGVLSNNGVLLDNKDLSKLVGSTEEEIQKLLDELEAKKVFSRLSDGSVVNRRMYKASQIQKKRSEAGKKGMSIRYQKGNKRYNKPLTPLENENEYNKEGSVRGGGKKDKKLIVEAIDYLNKKTGKNFKANSKTTISLIEARLKDWTIDDIKRVIDIKTAKWKGATWKDSRTGETVSGDDFLRPSTLFNATKFENYLNESLPLPENKNISLDDIRKQKAEYLAKNPHPLDKEISKDGNS